MSEIFKPRSINRKSRVRAGFTLVELAIVIAIMAVISGIAFLGLFNYRGSQNLKLSMSEVIAVVRDTQKRSITQEAGKQWGIRFSNLTNDDSGYQVFKGASFASGTIDKSYGLKRGVKFSEPRALSTYEVVFAPVSGSFSKTKIISFVTGRKDSLVGDAIINTLGNILTRIETDVFGYWHFDEGTSSLVYDASGAGNAGTIYSDYDPCSPCRNWQSGVSCRAGNCLLFNTLAPPHEEYIFGELNQPVTVSAFTIETWIKINSNQNKAGIWTGYDEDFYQTISGRFDDSSRKPSFATRAVDGSEHTLKAKGFLKNPVWYHLAYVYDGQYKRIYINGVENIETPLLDKTFQINYFDIGRSELDNRYLLAGYLDEVKFYKRALSAPEILAHYNDFK